MMTKMFFISILFLFFGFSLKAQSEISLEGKWHFKLDRKDEGLNGKWFNKKLLRTLKLPGSLNSNNIGDEPGINTKWTGSIYDSSFFFQPRLAKFRTPDNYKVPFWLTPLKHYVGVAWFQKEINIPAGWNGNLVNLFLERVHIQSRVWLDGIEIGNGHNSLVAPHEYLLPGNMKTGKHVLTIRIDNRVTEVNVGSNSNSVSDHTQGNWNGIIGKILLEKKPPVYLENIQVYPDIQNKKAIVKMKVVNTTNNLFDGKIRLRVGSIKVNDKIPFVFKNVSVGTEKSVLVEIELPLGDKIRLWNEFHPHLYTLDVFVTNGKIEDSKKVQFGMRDIKVVGKDILVNGVPVFLRGDVNNCEFPLTGFPPTDLPAWERIFKILKAHGLNHVRFHSWCPPQAAFEAADKLGFYLQPEGPSWPNHSTSLGDGKFIDQYILDETNRMNDYYGNYASFTMLAAGNEPRGGRQVDYLTKFINYWKEKDSRKIYTGASVAMSWPLVPANEFMIKSGARNLSWTNGPESESDYRKAVENFTMPYITHEQGQWCVFPNFAEIKKYTGAYRAKNFELFEEDLKQQGMADEARQFLMASGKLQALCYKAEIEKSFRTTDLSGFQLLGLQDFPGQGTALVGVLDAFYDEKGYIKAHEFKRFCNAVVPLIRVPKFVYMNNETIKADVELFQFEDKPLTAPVSWILKNKNGSTIAKGNFKSQTYKIGNCLPVGKIEIPLDKVSDPTELKLAISVDGTAYANDWDFWVYPSNVNVEESNSIYYTATLDAKATSVLNSGGKVFLNAAGKVMKGKEVVQRFLPVFWNTSWFKMRPPHTLGILVKNESAAFKYFPTTYHSDFQWFDIVNNAQVMHLEDFPKSFRPLVQPIDTWFMNRRLGLIFEAKVGKGKLLVCSANLKNDLEKRPAAKQLFYSLQQYMLSSSFNPKDEIQLNVVKKLFTEPSKFVWDAFTKDSPDELKPAIK